MAEIPYLCSIDMNDNEIKNLKLHVLSGSDPTGEAGMIFYDGDDNLLKFHNGTAFISPVMASSGAVTSITSLLATDIKIGEDDQTKIDFETANEIHFYANNANEMIIQANVVAPGADNNTALGDANQRWSDLFLASGAVINFNNGDVTATHSSNALTIAGGTFATAALTASTGVFSGILKTDDTTAATSTTDGSLQTDGGLSVKLDAVVGDDLILLSDASVIHFGANKDVTLTHVHNQGLTLTHAGSAGSDNKPIVLQLKSEENAVVDGDALAAIEFAAGDSDGTDGATVAAAITAIAEGTFSGSANPTKLVFTTGVSETAGIASGVQESTPKMTLSSAGLLTIADDLIVKNGGTIGTAADADLLTMGNGILTVAGEISVTTLDIGGTNVSSTAAELNALDGITAVVGELNALDIGSTAVGTAVASKAIILDSNKDYTGVRNFTVSGELDAATGDFSGAVDIAGDLTLSAGADGALTFGAASSIKIVDNQAASLVIEEANTAYMTFKTTNSSELITANKAFNAAGAFQISGTAVTSTAAELNILDGVTSTAAELNALDGITAVVGELNALDIGSTAVGTAVASKAVILDSNKDYTGLRHLTLSGELDGGSLDISGNADIAGDLTGLDNVTSTNYIIGGHTISDIDIGTEFNDVDDHVMSSGAIVAKFGIKAGSSSVVTTGALNSGSITSGFGTINTGSSAITTTGLISGGSLDIDDVLINGSNIGHTDDTDLIALSDQLVTINGGLTVTGTTTTNNVVTVTTSSGVIFEGTAADGHDATLKSVVASSDKTYTLPNVSGHVALFATDPSTTAIAATVAELNILDGVTSTAAELNILDGVTSTAAELNILDGVTSTAAELNILDGVTSTAAELNALDGITAVVGELNALDLGSTAVGNAIASKAVILDSNKDYTGLRHVTLSGELDAGSLDVSGNADIDGTMEADAITVNGTALAEFISDTAGAMFSSNTETNVVVTYQDADNTLDVVVADAAADAKGVVELATTDEALAGTDTARAVTAAGLAARSYRNAYGDGSATDYTVNHALGTRDVIVQCYDASDYKTVYACVLRTDANNVTVTTAVAAARNDLIVLVTKID